MECVSEGHPHTESPPLPPQSTNQRATGAWPDVTLPGLPPDHRARPALAKALSALRSGQPLDEQALVSLAWEHFLAGFAAGASAEVEGELEGVSNATPARETNPPSTRTRDPIASAASPSLAERVAHLTPRRLEVLRLVARGLTNREIGEVLGISGYTVKSHLASLFEALDVTNRTEAAFALQQHEPVA